MQRPSIRPVGGISAHSAGAGQVYSFGKSYLSLAVPAARNVTGDGLPLGPSMAAVLCPEPKPPAVCWGFLLLAVPSHLVARPIVATVPTSMAVVANTRALPWMIRASGLPGITSPHAAAAVPAVRHSGIGSFRLSTVLAAEPCLKSDSGASTARAMNAAYAHQRNGAYAEPMFAARTTPITAVYAARASVGTAATSASVESSTTDLPGGVVSRFTASLASVLALISSSAFSGADTSWHYLRLPRAWAA